MGGFSEALQSWWAPGLAFLAGIVSFASPCVFPVVPGYLSFITGGRDEAEGRPWAPMLLFVLGFAVIFTPLGAFTRVFAPIIRSPLGQRIAGVVVMAIGLLMVLYAMGIGGMALFAERRPFLSRIRPGRAGAMPLGMAFAAGWTPCIGPVLAGILTLAGAAGGGLWGAVLMFSYSLGLGVPFVLVGLGVRRLTGTLSFVKRNYHWIAGVSGVVLMTIGLLVVLNLWVPLLTRLGILRAIGNYTPPL